MKTKGKKWLLSVLVVMFAFCLLAGACVACKDNPTPQPSVEGAEKGAYVYDDITLTLNGTSLFTLSQGDNVSSGTYVSDESGLYTLTFEKTEDGVATCTLDGDVLVFTYGTSVYRLYKQVKFSVTFNDGESTSVASVTNGTCVSKPADPVKEGYKFVGWYKNSDFSGNPFAFSAEIITGDVTLYARWVEYDATAKEYTVSFDLGYEEATAIATQKTINGKLYGQLPQPERNGYTFKGWWVSAYNQADKLSYRYSENDVFTSDTVLFALWQQDGATLATMDVTASGVSWAGVSSEAKLVITKPDGTTEEHNFGAGGASAYEFAMSDRAAGEYKYTLTYGENTVERYYLNKALARVSGFSVVGNSVLLFDGVDNAEGYYITVKCGNEGHEHASVYIGKSTNYNFVNCLMKEGGIEFEVKAVAKNYCESTATFTYERTLDSVGDIKYDETTGMLSWSSVSGAQHYIVTINDAEVFYLGTENKLNVKYMPAGQLNVVVKAYTEGYNSGAAATATIEKKDPAAPVNLAVKDSVVTWSQVEGATSYRLQIGNKTATSEINEFTLDANYISLGNEYEIKVKAVFADGESLWSDVLLTNSYTVSAGMSGLTYENGTFSWTTMLDAVSYEYSVNDEKAKTTTDAYANVEFTKAGVNELQVRFLSSTGEYSEWATLEVYAYALTLDVTGGTSLGKQSKLYKAIGDSVDLPASERLGYTFDGWYNVEGGAKSNGAQYTSKTYDTPVDLVLYANWTPRTYTITLNYNEYGTGETETVTVTYTKKYTLPVPTLKNTEEAAQKAFVGWYSSADGKGAQFTDELGESINNWNVTSDTTLYAKYVDAFSFSKDGDGYSVKANKSLGYYTESIKIPSTYKGLPVRSISEYGFKDYYYLKKIMLPDTLESIPSTAFENCSRIESYEVYSTGVNNPVFSSQSGSLLQTLSGTTSLYMIPTATTGTYKIPAGVAKIGPNTFKKVKFDTIIIPSSIVAIDGDAFVSCSSLKNVIFEDGGDQPLTIDSEAFSETAYVEKFVLPARLAEIENVQKFFSQFKLLSSLEVVGTYEGQVYASLTKSDGGKNIAGMLANADKDTIIYCPISITGDYDDEDFEVVVPTTIIEIADHAFDSFDSGYSAALRKNNPVTKITFESIAIVGDYAFNNSKNLTEVVFKAVANPAEVTIGDYAFNGCSALATVTFEEEGSWADDDTFTATKTSGVTAIGDYAFASVGIETLKLPNSLKTLGKHAFESCSSIMTLDFANVSPELVFGDYAFAKCRALTSVELSKNVGEMEFNLVFYGCDKLQITVSPENPYYTADDKGVIYDREITKIIYYPDGYEGEYVIPDTVTSIGGAVFKGKSSMKAIVISASVTQIGDSAFEDCDQLTSVKFVENGEKMTIGNKAFYNCTSLKSIEIPGRVVSIGDECFRYYGVAQSSRALENITLNEGLEEIGDYAFYNTGNLLSINIPASVTNIGYAAFSSSGLRAITFADRNGNALNFDKYVFQYDYSLTNVVLPEGLVNIPEGTFYDNSELRSVTVPSTVRNVNSERAIGRQAFYGCAKLSDLVFTKGGTEDMSFAGGAFYGCDSLTTLSLPNRIASMDEKAYDVFELGGGGSGTYSGLNGNVYAWENSSYIGKTTQVSQIENIEVEEGGNYFSSYKGVLYNADKSVLVWCPFAKKGNVEISKETKTIRSSAFYACIGVTSVTFEEGGTADFEMADVADSSLNATSLRDSKLVFFGCYNLTSITFPARLTRLGKYALCNATGQTMTIGDKRVDVYANGITEVKFADNCKLTEIGEGAFWSSYVTEIELPASVTTVGKNAFNKSALGKITVSANMDAESLANISSSASGLKNVIVPEGSNTLTSAYEGQIIYTKDITEILYVSPSFEVDLFTIPATIKNIAANAFKDRTGIKAIEFETGTENLTIGNYAFSGTGITSIQLPARIHEMGENVLRDCKSLKTVTFEDGFVYTAIPDYTFYGCAALESVTIPGEVTSIGRSAFNGCGVKDENGNVSGLKTVIFDVTADGSLSNLTDILSDAFKDCYALSSLNLKVVDSKGNVSYEKNTLPYSVTTLGKAETYYAGPFQNCVSLTEITLPSSLTYLSKSIFDGCTSLATVNLPEKLELIKELAFHNTAITKLDLSGYKDGSLTIEGGAFAGAAKLTGIDLSKVDTLYMKTDSGSTYTFEGCVSLGEITIDNDINIFYTVGKPEYNYGTYSGFKNAGIKRLTINQDVKNSMFMNCTGLIEVIFGENVTEIADNAFKGCTNLKTVDLSVVSDLYIGSNAFANCTSLESFDLSKVTESDSGVFMGCTSLTSVGTLNEGLTELGNDMFKNTGLTSFDLSNVKTLGSSVFAGSALEEITIPANVTKIGASCFSDCASLTKAVYNSTVASMPGSLFKNCTKLTEITLGDSVTKIGSSSFEGSGISEIDLNKVNTIGGSSFKDCASLKKVIVRSDNIALDSYGTSFQGVWGVQFEVPDSSSKFYADGGILYKDTTLIINLDTRKNVEVKIGTIAIDRNAFRNNTYVETVKLPDSVTTVDGYFTFAGCTNLKSINLEKVTGWKVSSSSQQEAFKDTAITELTLTSAGAGVFRTMKNLKTVTFVNEDGVEIGKQAFQDCTALATVTGNITKVGDYAFKNCTSLKDFGAFAGLTSIGANAFENAGLTSVVIPAGITSVSNNAFKNCANLTSVTIHEGVTQIGTSAFNGCYKLVEVINHSALKLVAGNTDNGYVAAYAISVVDAEASEVEQIGDYLFYSDGTTDYLVAYVGSDTELTLPANYNGAAYALYKYLFYNNTNITSVVGNDNVTAIGDYAFYGCTALENISGFGKITAIGDNAFNGCPVTSLTIPDTVEEIGDYAFSGCNALIATESNNALYLGSSDNYYEVLLKATDKTIESCEINSATKFIASEAFSGCSALTSITIPEGVVSIGARAFYNCSKLESAEIPSIVTYIGSEAFSGCSALAAVTLPEGLTEIGDKAFYYCTSLTSVVVPKTVTKLGTEVFNECAKLESATILATLNKIPDKTFRNCAALTSVTLQPGITEIGESAFSGCKQLTKIDNFDKVVTLGKSAFYNCGSLTSLGKLENLTKIDDQAFYGCSALTELNASDKLTYIGSRAFYNCTSLKTLTLYGNLTYIDNSAFYKFGTDQTIVFTQFTAAPTLWNKSWKSSCNANIVWATATV